MDMNAEKPAFYLPSLDIDDLPGDVKMQITPWTQMHNRGGAILVDIDWWRYTMSGSKWNYRH